MASSVMKEEVLKEAIEIEAGGFHHLHTNKYIALIYTKRDK